MFNKLSRNPYIAFFWVLFIDFLVTGGYLYPEQRDKWVNDGLYLIGSVGILAFAGIWYHHRLDQHKKEQLGGKGTTSTVEKINTEVREEANKISQLFHSLKYFFFTK